MGIVIMLDNESWWQGKAVRQTILFAPSSLPDTPIDEFRYDLILESGSQGVRVGTHRCLKSG
jgi:hypothetical protein